MRFCIRPMMEPWSSWPSWISARVRSHSRLGHEGQKGHLITNALARPFSPSPLFELADLGGKPPIAFGIMRVKVQLIDAETGAHLWAERFDKPLADLFDMQDEIVARLANALNPQLTAAEARRAERAPHPELGGPSISGNGLVRHQLSDRVPANAQDPGDQRRAYGLRNEEYLRLKILTCMLPML